ncbi:MAG: hypothetical protein GQ576_07030, partial [Methanococcoides sp.]|nr:hypothetical protein [Methanococcoides sp.]
ATKKQLQKLAKDEKAEVELIRVKEKTIAATEKVKTHAELSKQISQTRTKIRSLEKTFEITKDLTVKVRIKTAQKQLRQLEAEMIKREMVFEDIKALKQKVRSTRTKTKQVERVKLEASERLKVLEGIALKSTQRVKVTERIKTPERVKVKEVEKVKELEKVREFERSIEVVKTIEREIESETQKESQRLRQRVKEEVMPEIKIAIPKIRTVKKKKAVKVTRKVSKEYTNFQIVNTMNGIDQLFG